MGTGFHYRRFADGTQFSRAFVFNHKEHKDFWEVLFVPFVFFVVD
jgi:hypothetical protein